FHDMGRVYHARLSAPGLGQPRGHGDTSLFVWWVSATRELVRRFERGLRPRNRFSGGGSEGGRRPPPTILTPMIWTSMLRGRGPSSSANRVDRKRPREGSPPLMPTATLRPRRAARRCDCALPRSQSE